jgi:hypothetical protein
MSNLEPPIGDLDSRRPFQQGEAKGTKNGKAVTISTEWLIDTGADISKLRADNAAHFDLVPTGTIARGTGGGMMFAYSGLTMRFKREDRNGTEEWVECALAVAVGASGSNIIGMDQLAEVGCTIEWNPATRTGRIYEST